VKDNVIHPTAVVGDGVILGSGNRIDAHVVITGHVVIGDSNWFCAGTIIGAAPEIRAIRPDSAGHFDGSFAGVVIGSNNVFREASQVHQGHKRATTIGDDVYVMNQVYIAHDCLLDSGATLASSVLLAGNVHIHRSANIGLGTTVHQGIEIGPLSMVGMGSVVTRPVPAFSKAYGVPSRAVGINTVGLSRAGFSDEEIAQFVADGDSGKFLPNDDAVNLMSSRAGSA
jgi:UDP-N-acetylglucosamine acyltransferase